MKCRIKRYRSAKALSKKRGFRTVVPQVNSDPTPLPSSPNKSATTTRELLAAALKAQLVSLPIDKVTVSALSAAVGINRQTFYYHFSDVYDLAAWVFEEDIARHIMAHATYSQWAEGFRAMLTYMKDNSEQTYAVIHSLTHQELQGFFFVQFCQMMEAIVDELQGDLVLNEADRRFVIDHYAVTVLGHLLHWLATKMRENPDVLVANIEKAMRGNVRQSLERFAIR